MIGYLNGLFIQLQYDGFSISLDTVNRLLNDVQLYPTDNDRSTTAYQNQRLLDLDYCKYEYTSLEYMPIRDLKPMEKTAIGVLKPEAIQSKIFTIRGVQVMIDRDLTELYGAETKRINEQVKRNADRFPGRYCFQLTEKEKDEVVANCDHLSTLKFSYQLPYAFSEQGVAMLSTVLKSEMAVKNIWSNLPSVSNCFLSSVSKRWKIAAFSCRNLRMATKLSMI